jgi:hypothetical protein
MTGPSLATFLCLPGADPVRLAANLAACLPDWTGTITPIPGDSMPERTGRMVVLYPGWLERLTEAMAAGQPPCAALEDWTAQTETLLALHRANRRRMLLVPPLLLQVGVPADLQALARWAGLDPTQVRTPAEPAAALSPLLSVLARQAFAETPQAHDPALALSAACLPMSDPASETPCVSDAGFARFQALSLAERAQADLMADLESAHTEKAGLQQHLDLMHENIARCQEELAQLTASERVTSAEKTELERSKAGLVADVARLQDQTARLMADLESAHTEKAGLQQHLDLMHENIARCQEELAQLTASERVTSAEKTELERSKAGLVADVARLQDQTARLMADLESAHTEKAGLQQHLDLMHENIARCQEELARLIASEQAVLGSRAKLEHEVILQRKSAEAERSALERQLLRRDQAEERRSDCRQALALAQETIQRMSGEIRLMVEQMTRGIPG